VPLEGALDVQPKLVYHQIGFDMLPDAQQCASLGRNKTALGAFRAYAVYKQDSLSLGRNTTSIRGHLRLPVSEDKLRGLRLN
jgi:hypothetical protein